MGAARADDARPLECGRLDRRVRRRGRNYRFRARGRRDGAWSGWSDWTAAAVLLEDGRVFPRTDRDLDRDVPVREAGSAAAADATPLALADFKPSSFRPLPPIEWLAVDAGLGSLALAWSCLHAFKSREYATHYVLRWREAGTGDWRYRPVPHLWDQGWGGGLHCSHELDGIPPGTAYELQIAGYGGARSVAPPDLLNWSETLRAATAPRYIDARVEREGSQVLVRWPAESAAQRYLVRLRGDGWSRWRLVNASGAARQSAAFEVPPGGDYAAEVFLARNRGSVYHALTDVPPAGAIFCR